MKNLRQLLGWVESGERQGKKAEARHKSSNWQLLEHVRYLKHDERSEFVPIVGSNEHIFKTVVQPHQHINFSSVSLNNLLSRSKPHISIQGGVYIFSMIVDLMQVRCSIAVSLSPRCLCCRACLVALPGSWPPAGTHCTLPQLTDDGLCVLFCAQLQKAGAALKKGEKRVRANDGFFVFPLLSCMCVALGTVSGHRMWRASRDFCSIFYFGCFERI